VFSKAKIEDRYRSAHIPFAARLLSNVHLIYMFDSSGRLRPHYSRELELAIFGSLILGVDKLPFKAQTIESFTNLQALNSLSMVKVRYQGGNDIKQRSNHDKQKNA
jgi:hypothetical protein